MKTALCDLLGIEYPIIQAGMGTVPDAGLVAAVCEAGALGTLSSFQRTFEDFSRELRLLSDLTERPFAVNHLVPFIPAGAFEASLSVHPRVVSLALDDPGDLVKQAHAAGALVMHQVTTVTQAVQAAERGVDVVIAQGTEAGGLSGSVALFPLLPQVVDAVSPVPVVAAGGIFDGRGLAAALTLGAVEVNIGTRFLASIEARVSDEGKRLILKAHSEDVVKADVLNDIGLTPGEQGYGTVARFVTTPFLDGLQANRTAARERADELREQIVQLQREGHRYDAFGPGAGQSAGGITDVTPVAEIIQRLVREAEGTLRNVAALMNRRE
jgi:enoyl-[acyl-carrier protein] reductase II